VSNIGAFDIKTIHFGTNNDPVSLGEFPAEIPLIVFLFRAVAKQVSKLGKSKGSDVFIDILLDLTLWTLADPSKTGKKVLAQAQ
jgi:hypothetical protein